MILLNGVVNGAIDTPSFPLRHSRRTGDRARSQLAESVVREDHRQTHKNRPGSPEAIEHRV